jgi:hypothetical protein
MLFALPSFQREQSFQTFREPHRYDRHDKEYFVRLLQKFQKIGKFIFNYDEDERIYSKSSSAKQTQYIRSAQKNLHNL